MTSETLADFVAVLHGLVAIFVVGGFLAILIGLWRRWAMARNFWFRFVHLATCLVINLFEFANQPCPLTSLEKWLRARNAYQGGFIQQYVSESMHLDVPPRALAWPTLGLLLAVTALYFWKGPRKNLAAGPGGAPNPAPTGQPCTLLPTASASTRQVAATVLLLAMGAASFEPLLDVIGEWLYPRVIIGVLVLLEYADAKTIHSGLFLAASLGLCSFTPRACGLNLGDPMGWREHDVWILLFCAVPPLLVVVVYANLSYKPFHGVPMSFWLCSSLAQEFLFSGFVYARLATLFGAPRMGWRGSWSKPMLLAPALFALWHWPNFMHLQHGYFVFQLLYTFIGGWWGLHLRRWTGSLWPGVASHVLVNYLASVV